MINTIALCIGVLFLMAVAFSMGMQSGNKDHALARMKIERDLAEATKNLFLLQRRFETVEERLQTAVSKLRSEQ